MTKPKYQIGDRIGQWLIIHAYFSNQFDSWVYNLELVKDNRQLVRFEHGVDRMIEKYGKAKS